MQKVKKTYPENHNICLKTQLNQLGVDSNKNLEITNYNDSLLQLNFDDNENLYYKQDGKMMEDKRSLKIPRTSEDLHAHGLYLWGIVEDKS